jgi:hypothetical protein
VLVVPHGRTTADDLEAAAAELRMTGAHLLGAVVAGAPARTVRRGWTKPLPQANSAGYARPVTPTAAQAGAGNARPVAAGAPPGNGSRPRPSPRPRSMPQSSGRPMS